MKNTDLSFFSARKIPCGSDFAEKELFEFIDRYRKRGTRDLTLGRDGRQFVQPACGDRFLQSVGGGNIRSVVSQSAVGAEKARHK